MWVPVPHFSCGFFSNFVFTPLSSARSHSHILISPAFSLLSLFCLLKMHWTALSFSVPLAVKRNREACQAVIIIFPFAYHQLYQKPLSHCWAYVNVSTITIKAHLSALFLWMASEANGWCLSVGLCSHLQRVYVVGYVHVFHLGIVSITDLFLYISLESLILYINCWLYLFTGIYIFISWFISFIFFFIVLSLILLIQQIFFLNHLICYTLGSI